VRERGPAYHPLMVEQSMRPVGTRVTRVHRAWWVALVTFLALVAAAAFRSSIGVLLEPIEHDLGWTRSWTSAAVAVNFMFYGLVAPFAAALMERFGIRQVVALALVLFAVGTGLTLVMREPWQLVVLWGVVIGFGAGSMAVGFGAMVANRWFAARRGLVTGAFSATSATGQLVFLPAIAWLATAHGWRFAELLIAGLALVTVPLVLGLLVNRPSDVGLRPYGSEEVPPAVAAPDGPPARPAAVAELRRLSSSWPFWALFLTFFVCGWSTNGLIGTHFVAAAHDHGMPPTAAASLLVVVGIFDVLGTLGSGWLSDRVDSRLLLVAYYGLRGLSLMAFPAVLGPQVHPTLLLMIAFYGLDWVATVPPTITLCRQHFGLTRSAVAFGWVFAGHMVGAACAAQLAGVVRELVGSYEPAWWTAGGLCLVAACLILTVPYRDPRAPDLA
jgi:MFS family permease